MMNTIASMYVTLMPVIFMGILNMVWCKSDYMKVLKVPIDGGKCFVDGERVLGDNKTVKGMLGYIVIGALTTIVWGEICSYVMTLANHNYLYTTHANTVLYNLILGLLFGIAYSVFEFPNSFLKRRFKIQPGRPAVGFKKIFFIFLDQVDSLIGCILIVCIVYNMSLIMYIVYVLIGAFTHIFVNIILFSLKLRKNML